MAFDEAEHPSSRNHGHGEMDKIPSEPLMRFLKQVIHWAVRCMAVLMTVVIMLGVVDVGLMLWQSIQSEPFLMIRMDNIIAMFGAFMAVLIAIEIFVNITIYLRDDVIHVKIVMATALMAVARKVIIMDVEQVSPDFVLSIAAVVLAMSIGYYLVVVRGDLAPNRHPPTPNPVSDASMHTAAKEEPWDDKQPPT